jgi:hypothetical protein
MQDQLPVPALELILLNLYLGSVSYLLAIAFVFVVCRANTFRWLSFLLLSLLTIILGSMGSFLIWAMWDEARFDMVYGPFHLPTLMSLVMITPLVLRLTGRQLKLTKGTKQTQN